MKHVILTLFLIFNISIINSQEKKDLIIDLEGNEIQCDIKSISPNKIEYNDNGNLNSIDIEKIFIVKKKDDLILKYNVVEIEISKDSYLKIMKDYYKYYNAAEKARIAFYDAADVKEKAQQKRIAQALYQMAINRNRKSDSAYIGLVHVSNKKQKEYLDKAIELNPNKYDHHDFKLDYWSWPYNFNYGTIEEKLNYINSIFDRFPDNCNLFSQRSRTHIQLEDYLSALKDIEVAMDKCGLKYEFVMVRLEANFRLLKLIKKEKDKEQIMELQTQIGNDYLKALTIFESSNQTYNRHNKYRKFEKYANE